MSKKAHLIYIWTMILITAGITAYLSFAGYEYYITPREDRFYLANHDWFKPSGIFGHGLGIIGTLMILFGVVIYILHKRYNILGNFIRLKYLLEFHIFLCTLGPILILFHTAFKFGGIVSVAFWSMVAVVLSGVIGRFIYIQIPRTIEGRELGLNEIQQIKLNLSDTIRETTSENEHIISVVESITKNGKKRNFLHRRKALNQIRTALRSQQIGKKIRSSVLNMAKEEISLAVRIERLQTMQRLFKYWHVAHLPFALIMLIIVVFHVAVTLIFGYTWIF